MRAVDFVESYFDAWNHGDARRVAGHLAANGTYCDVPIQLHRSREELVAHLVEFFAKEHPRYDVIGDILTGHNTVAFQYRVTFDDGTADYFGAEFVTFDGDAASEISDYYEIPNVVAADTEANSDLGLSNAMRRKYAKSGLSDAQMGTYTHRLVSLMQTKRAYLRPDLTLPKLAALVDCSVNHLSQVINSGFSTSFFGFLNHYRIEYAKSLLAEPGDPNRAILNIAFEVGFNSNSAFYAAFKKDSGQSPAQFRRLALKKAGRI